jgi:hypothetical protein
MANVQLAKDVFLANRHTGPIVLPRFYAPNADGDPAKMRVMFASRTINSGHVGKIPAEEWEIRSKSPALQYYLDNGHLEIVKQNAAEADLKTDSIVDLEIPDHLQPDPDGGVSVESATGNGDRVSATIRQAKKGSVTV